MNNFDAIVVGSGINGLVAAAELSGAGWRVCLVEANDRLGGFMATDELTVPGLRHDTYSSWHPLFVTGGAHAELGEDLARLGVEYCNAEDAVTATVAADGRAAIAYRDVAKTIDAFEHPADREAYGRMLDRLVADLDVIGGLLGSELRSAKIASPVFKLFRRGGRARLEGWARDGVASGRRWGRRQFRGWETDQLWAPWLLHAGLTPDSATGGLMIPLFAATLHQAGLPIVKGGQGAFLAAFEALLAERGVDVRTGARVSEITTQGKRATGVKLADGTTLRAERAVVASVSPGALYHELLPATVVPDEIRAEADVYQPGRAAMQVHIALREPLVWRDERLAGIPLVHLSDGSNSTAIACVQAEAGLLPARPTVAVGQQQLIDPSRVTAEGKGMLWLQMQEVPYAPVGDAAGTLDVSGGWTEELKQGYLDRVLDVIEEQAPGVKAAVEKAVVIAPTDLEAYNPNAINGDPYGGSAELDQFLIWRPGPASSRHRTVVPGLWHIGAATHPGPGLGGGSGHLVAQELIGRKRK
ncbi:phytoene desaturase family protein [Enemella sp. A6]|uniref:phytoene desaturase family protein n=1 Tax=Enemella sp. A6 TaxID=3440152 RepID=UPI003EBBB494